MITSAPSQNRKVLWFLIAVEQNPTKTMDHRGHDEQHETTVAMSMMMDDDRDNNYYDNTQESDNEEEEDEEAEENTSPSSESSSLEMESSSPYQMIKGTLAQNLMEKILRNKIINCTYYKMNCFGLNAETLIDRAMELESVGGTFGGNRKPSAFLCLLFKMLQIQPEREIVLAYITNRNHKYVTVLGAVYLRLTGKPVDVYTYLELLYSDYRKIVKQKVNGRYELVHMDEIADELLTSDYAYDMNLPYLPRRKLLEDAGLIDSRVTVLSREELKQMAEEDEEAEKREKERERERQQKQRISSSSSSFNYDSSSRAKRDDEYRYRERRSDYNRDERRSMLSSSSSSYSSRQRDDRDDRDRDNKLREERKPGDVPFSKYSLPKKHSNELSMSVEDTNKLRAKLGLRPLRL